MVMGLVGKKCGMTQLFTESGLSIPVTVIEVLANRVTQIKTSSTDGYCAVQVTFGTKSAFKLTKPLAGHYAKASVEPGLGLYEFPLTEDNIDNIKVGDQIKLDIFKKGQIVDVSGVSKGKGFAGVIKRYNFATQDATHGNSLSHRAPGSIGQRQSPGRVFKGKKMGGQMGNKSCTIKSQEIAKIDIDRNLILIKGSVPGAPGSKVVIKLSATNKQKKI
jgi:large subunit ribosomal protein L3